MSRGSLSHRLLPLALVFAVATALIHIVIGSANPLGLSPAVPVEARTP